MSSFPHVRAGLRVAILSTLLCGVLVVVSACTPAPSNAPSPTTSPAPEADVRVPSTPENIVWGGLPIDQSAIATVESGEVVQIDTVSGVGISDPTLSPAEYLAQYGVEEDEILPDQVAFWETVGERPQYGPHTLTGPINIEGAQPGDTLMIEVLSVETRTDWGMNITASNSGVFAETYPGYRAGDEPLDIPIAIPEAYTAVSPGVGQHLVRTGTAEAGANQGEKVAFFNNGTEIPLQEFFGVMGVKPADGQYIGFSPDASPYPDGVQSSIPPGPFGGNLDTRDYTDGAILYLPVYQEGAGFYLGDGHSAQGDGEVSGTAIEQSLSGTFRFTLLKGRESVGPSGEDAENFLVHGIDWDANRALKFAVSNTVELSKRTKNLTTAEAYSLASISVSCSISEAVDETQVVTARIPKALWEETGRGKQTDLADQALTSASTLTVP